MLFARLFIKHKEEPNKKLHGVTKYLETFCGQPIGKKMRVIPTEGLTPEDITCKECKRILEELKNS